MSKSITFSNENVSKNILKNAIWLYFWLLLFEGGLRKWILPGLSTPLLIVRDPIAFFIILKAFNNHLVKFNLYLLLFFILSFISIPLAVYLGHGNLIVAIFGARITFLQFPLIFVIGRVFCLSDVIKLGKFVVMLIIPMTILIAVQFYSPQSAFVNRGIGGDENGAGFSGALGFFRPPGTFSFTNGNVLYYCLATCFVFYFWLSKEEQINKILLILSSIALIIAVPLCISRTLIFQIMFTGLFVFILLKDSKALIKAIGITFLGLLFFYILSNFSFFHTSIEVFLDRFETANESEGGVNSVFIDRFLGGLITAVSNNGASLPFFGYGVGLGTNVGSQITTGEVTFLISEQEWGRIVGEMGFVIGVSVILTRVILGFDLLIKSYKQINKDNIMPWILMSFGFLSILQSQCGAPTNLGFTVLIGGLSMAAINDVS